MPEPPPSHPSAACPNCGLPWPPKAIVCPDCGTLRPAAPPPPSGGFVAPPPSTGAGPWALLGFPAGACLAALLCGLGLLVIAVIVVGQMLAGCSKALNGI